MLFAAAIRFVEEPLSALGYAEQDDSLIHIGEIGVHPQFEFAGDLAFFVPVVGGELLKQLVVDLAIDVREKELFHPPADFVALKLEPLGLPNVVSLDQVKVFLDRVAKPLEHRLGHRDTLDHRGELLDQRLFPHIGLAALLLCVAAAVVNILLLLDVPDQQAAAVPALDKAGEQEVLLDPTDVSVVATVQDALDPLPERYRYQWLVRPDIPFAEPIEFACINAGAQHLVDGAGAERLLTLSIGHALAARPHADPLQRIHPGCVPFEQAHDTDGGLRIDLDDFLAVRTNHVPVAERRDRGPDALLGLLQHTLPGLLGQVVDVVLCHQHLNAVHEFFGRSGVAGQDDTLLHEVNVDVEIIDRHPIAQIAIKAVRFLDQDRVDGRVAAQVRDHRVEFRPTARLGGFDIDIFLSNADLVFRRITTKQLELCVDRKTFAILLFRRNARVQDCAMAD